VADSGSLTLARLGWHAFFADQVGRDERAYVPARVFGVRRRSLTVVFEGGEADLHLGGRWFKLPPESRPTIGDWVLMDRDRTTIVRVLARRSLLVRRAAGQSHELQPMAANVDTMFLVTSCNEEFNRSRVERYLALALDAGVRPVIVLTKADLADSGEAYREAAAALLRDLPVELVDARDPATLAGVRAWCGPGQTVALLGSSGVGKSTLVNSLAGADLQATGAIRAADAKGRHTTTHRSLHVLPDGGLLVDNPGMRELTLADVEQGVAELFSDVAELAATCRFSDCRHESEPGCAVRAALEAGTLDPRRLESYRKLGRDPAVRPEQTPQRPRAQQGRGTSQGRAQRGRSKRVR
jgi:ribosome biogenesis GTPase